jgi:P27 family predicted phage terminase small subunit
LKKNSTAKRKEPTPTQGYPACPSFITGEAKEEWDRVCAELDQMGTISTADRAVIAMYCTAWQRWRKAEERLAATNEIIASKKTEVPMYNLWLAVSNKAAAQLASHVFELGLSPNSRSKIKVPSTNKADDIPAGLEF